MLQNLLNILKVNGQVFLYENEWSKDKGSNIYKEINKIIFSVSF